MKHLAICRTCQLAFAFDVVAEGAAPARLPASVYCPRCGDQAFLSDGTVAGFFRLFNEAFPSATPKKLKREVWALASKIAAGSVTPAQALTARSDLDPEDRRFLWTVGLGIAALIVAVLTYLQNERLIESSQQDQDARTRVYEQMLSELRRIADSEDAEPLALLSDSREHSQRVARPESDDASKPKPRTGRRRQRRS